MIEVRNRIFVAVATGEYDDVVWASLPVQGEVEALSQLFCNEALGSRQFEHRHPELVGTPSEDAIRGALKDPRWSADDAVVVFVTGHGETGHGKHWLILHDTRSNHLKHTAIDTGTLVGWVDECRPDNVLLLLDTCYSGAVGKDIADFDDIPRRGHMIVASAPKFGKAESGALADAVAQFLQEAASPEGERFNHGPYLKARDFLAEVGGRLERSGQILVPLRWIPNDADEHVCLPNPRYREDRHSVDVVRRDLAIQPTDVEAHWGPKTRGIAASGDPGWFLTGRAALMSRLIAWTEAEPSNVIVTGQAGCGKSAVLSRLVTLSDPGFVGRYRDRVDEIAANLRPRSGAVDVAILATQKYPKEVVEQLCAAFGIAPDSGTSDVQGYLASWNHWLRSRTEPVTVVIDALDEAADPAGLLDLVLSRLEVAGKDKDGKEQSRKLRLLVGVRSTGGSGPGETSLNRQSLAARAESTLRATRLQADEGEWWEPADLRNYAYSILIDTPGSPYRGASDAAPVADAIAQRVGASYLMARLSAVMLASSTEVVTADDPHLLATLAQGVVGLFRDDLHAVARIDSEVERAVDLLRALAFGYGRGLPWNKIWPAVANAVADHRERQYGDGDVAWLIGSRLVGYLVTDREDHTTVYRLFHDELRSTLREQAGDLLAGRGYGR